LERFLFALHSFLKEIPPTGPEHPLEAARKLQKKAIAVPYSLPLPTEETNWKVSFQPPSDITLVGSWANKVSVKAKDGQKFGVDLALEMPNVSMSAPFAEVHSTQTPLGLVPREGLSQWSLFSQKVVLSCCHRLCYPEVKIFERGRFVRVVIG